MAAFARRGKPSEPTIAAASGACERAAGCRRSARRTALAAADQLDARWCNDHRRSSVGFGRSARSCTACCNICRTSRRLCGTAAAAAARSSARPSGGALPPEASSSGVLAQARRPFWTRPALDALFGPGVARRNRHRWQIITAVRAACRWILPGVSTGWRCLREQRRS